MPAGQTRLLAVCVSLFSVPIWLASFALPRLVEGWYLAPAKRVVEEISIGIRPPRQTCETALSAYLAALPENGEAAADEAMLRVLAARDPVVSFPIARRELVSALAEDPGNARAWNFLCTIEASRSPEAATRCLDADVKFSRYDWYAADQRTRLLSEEWPYLDESLRDSAADLIFPMWNTTGWSDDSTLRDILLDLSRTANGRQLLLAGLYLHPETMRAFNRWLIQKQMGIR